jgi:ornithine cyclodeaminase/alanine dehydrogenase-like protein (mu-crystallin family)
MRLLVLSDLATAAPLALVAETMLSTMRVGGTLALSIELLRAPSAQTLALVGTGRLARAAVVALQATCPFGEIRVASRSSEHRERFCGDLTTQGVVGLQPAMSLEAACSGADVILTITTANEPLIRADWCRPGSLLVTAGGGQECEDTAILGADRILVDDWAQCTLLGDLAVLHRQGKIAEHQIAGTLADVVAGCVPGRQSPAQRLVAVPQGLTILDVALGVYVYRIAMQRGLGTTVAGL